MRPCLSFCVLSFDGKDKYSQLTGVNYSASEFEGESIGCSNRVHEATCPVLVIMVDSVEPDSRLGSSSSDGCNGTSKVPEKSEAVHEELAGACASTLTSRCLDVTNLLISNGNLENKSTVDPGFAPRKSVIAESVEDKELALESLLK